jgi:hypothetical protein
LDYHATEIGEGTLHEGITKGLINLILNEGNKTDLNYWRPITLLTTFYNFFAKALQLRLQPILRYVISPEQTTFLSLRFTLDNNVLTQEALHWAKFSRQPTVFLKLDFSKAYDFSNFDRNKGVAKVFYEDQELCVVYESKYIPKIIVYTIYVFGCKFCFLCYYDWLNLFWFIALFS